MIPGEIILAKAAIEINAEKNTKTIKVRNLGDRPVQVGSHFHFFEVNKLLHFERAQAYGYRLNIASGTSVRFEPGEEKLVEVVELGGNKICVGLNGMTNGKIETTAEIIEMIEAVEEMMELTETIEVCR
ncbi:urease subunit beta [Candidatus Epulonipiscium viviparus]|uniref:urease subunit beta n=1 Tax=Candidatus Epulonipiscium viviparus TaxID=420336 RepID=UPI0027381026|nr:urease subunit beta [Candidatus Epulopiscium viviparus]